MLGWPTAAASFARTASNDWPEMMVAAHLDIRGPQNFEH
jgi:hypothetical protein